MVEIIGEIKGYTDGFAILDTFSYSYYIDANLLPNMEGKTVRIKITMVKT